MCMVAIVMCVEDTFQHRQLAVHMDVLLYYSRGTRRGGRALALVIAGFGFTSACWRLCG
jgi:hypothetical protein